MTAPRRIILKIKLPPAGDDGMSPAQATSLVDDDSTVRTTIKRKPRRGRPRLSKHSESSSTDSDLIPAVPPSIRSRILSESDISVLDLGPSLAEGITCPGKTEVRDCGRRRHENPRVNLAHLVWRPGSRAGSSSETQNSPSQRLCIDELDSQAVTSASTSVDNDNVLPLGLDQRSEAHSTTPATDLLPPVPAAKPVPVYGDIHNLGYGYGFSDGAVRLSSAGMVVRATGPGQSQAPFLQSSFGHPQSGQYWAINLGGGMDQESLDAYNEEIVRYEQSLDLFPGVVIEEPLLDEDES